MGAVWVSVWVSTKNDISSNDEYSAKSMNNKQITLEIT